MSVKALECNCVSEYQDKKYGKGNRVHNDKAKGQGWVCTVCDKVKS